MNDEQIIRAYDIELGDFLIYRNYSTWTCLIVEIHEVGRYSVLETWDGKITFSRFLTKIFTRQLWERVQVR